MIFFFLMQRILNLKRNAILRASLSEGMRQIGDFGCGHYPNRFANILVDDLSSKDEQRGGLAIDQTQPGREFHNIDLNVFPYPFPDKHFDFLICSHVLEHLNDPVQTCREFSRIARKGYIEVPFYSADLFVKNNDLIHNWLCAYDQKDKKLKFMDRKKWLSNFPPQRINIFLRFLLQLDNLAVVWTDALPATYVEFQSVDL